MNKKAVQPQLNRHTTFSMVRPAPPPPPLTTTTTTTTVVRDKRPSTIKPSLLSLLSFPYRICNPPPAVGKVRSFSVTPLFRVRLDDVLDRKHLPPLGLKDFEQWLLYVEMCPENLYFILWLREYRIRYAEWQSQLKRSKSNAFASHTASRLAAFHTRAKQIFFAPDAQYELNLTSTVLAPFQTKTQDPHPPPSFFDVVEAETRHMLEQSLRLFVEAQYNNVGTNRALCGIIAGSLFTLIGFLPPIAVNFATGSSRWLRLTALPGAWLGLTVLICAFHGVCLSIYILGDLRQLRKFELVRPPVDNSPKAILSSSSTHIPPPQPVILPPPPPPAHFVPATSHSHPFRHHHRSHLHRPGSSNSSLPVSEPNSTTAPSSSSREVHSIQVSPAYFDPDPIEGPATCPIVLEYCLPYNDEEWERQQQEEERRLELRQEQYLSTEGEENKKKRHARDSPEHFTPTATFIHPFQDEECMSYSTSRTKRTDYWNNNEDMFFWNARRYKKRAMTDLEKLGAHAADLNQKRKGEEEEDDDGQWIAKRQPLQVFDFDGLPPNPPKPPLRRSKTKSNSRSERLTAIGTDGRTRPTDADADTVQTAERRSQVKTTEGPWNDSEAVRVQREWKQKQAREARKARARSVVCHDILGNGGGQQQQQQQQQQQLEEFGNPRRPWLFDFLDRVQTRCSLRNWGAPLPIPRGSDSNLDASNATTPLPSPISLGGVPPYAASPTSPNSDFPSDSHYKYPPIPVPDRGEKRDEDEEPAPYVQKRSKLINSVPAFAVPLTRVLNPVIVRGQWEIVVRSVTIAFLLSWILCGTLVAVPEVRR